MSHRLDQLTRYVDGELDAGEAEAFALHAAVCPSCSAALHDALQLAALEAAVRQPAGARDPDPALRRERGVLSLLTARLRGRGRPGGNRSAWRSHYPVVIAAGAAAVVALWLIRRPAPQAPDVPTVALITAPERAIEGRISYAAADHHRPYNVARAAGSAAPRDAISLDTLAQLEHRNDLHGVAAAFVMLGDPSRAASYLDRAAADPDVTADRALLQLQAGHAAEALITLDRVLATRPRHPQALWNRALALRDLGLDASAAEAFEVVAALGEPGWAAEARARAQRLSADLDERGTAYKRLSFTDGPRLATAPDAVTPEAARRFPGVARLLVYDAVRGAASADAVRALAPIARTLDAVYGDGSLVAYVERIAHADFAVRAPLARRYASLVAGERLDEPAARSFLAALRAAHAEDILLGALIRTAPRGQVAADAIPELRKLCEATGDPWFHLLGIERAMAVLLDRGDRAGAEAVALPALVTCETSKLDYRCAAIAIVLGESYIHTVRLADARRLLTRSAERARRGGEWYQQERHIELFAQLALISDDVSGSTLPVARAYTRELVLRDPSNCELDVWGSNLVALLLVNRADFAGARTELAHANAVQARCPQAAPRVADMFVAAHVLRDPAAGGADDVARLRAQIDRARSEVLPGERAMLDQTEGRLLLDRDRAAGIALLERAIGEADALDPGDIDARKARSYAYVPLTLDAGHAGEWERVWTLLGRAARITPASRCGVGAAADDGTSVVVVRDADGASHGAFDATRSGLAIDAAHLVPPALEAKLRGCSEVDVVARPPVQGLPQLLPDDVAWSYRVDLDRHPVAPGPAPARATRLVIANTEPPASLGVARLLPWQSSEAPDVRLEGPSATPSRVLAEFTDATFIEVHSHGVADATGADAAFLMLSPDPDGRYALTAVEIRQHPLRGRPIVILAACHAATTATYRHEAWSLPAAFVAAGARAVIASTDVIDDAAAGAFFDDMRVRIEHGASPAVALRDVRIAWLTSHPGATWVHSVMVFQ